MWIKEPPRNIVSEESSISKLNFLYNHEKFYIMDNHLAAAWCWLQKLDVTAHYNFFHIDQHEDLHEDNPLKKDNEIINNPKISLDKFLSLEVDINQPWGKTEQQKVFDYANYIIQIKRLYPHWFDMCCFACPASVNNQFFKDAKNITYEELVTYISYCVHDGKEKNVYKPIPKQLNKWILNIDIDYFFYNDEFLIFTDDYIRHLCANILIRIDDIEVITIALSPECCGGWDKSYRIAKLMAECFELDFDIPELN